MKKLSLIIIFAVCFAFVFGQSNFSLLKQITTNLPDSIYIQSGYEKQLIYKVWETYETNPVNLDESFTDKVSRDYYFDYSELYPDGECCEHFYYYGIDTIGSLFKINYDTQLQIKIFEDNNDYIVGVCVSGIHGFASPEIISTQFYKWNGGELLDYTNEIFKEFNFATDNYTDETINWLNNYYQRDLYTEPTSKFLIYTLTPSDTIFIFDDFYDFACCADGNFYLDEDHIYDSLFWRAYIFDHCKLIPVGTVKKEKWTGKVLFE